MSIIFPSLPTSIFANVFYCLTGLSILSSVILSTCASAGAFGCDTLSPMTLPLASTLTKPNTAETRGLCLSNGMSSPCLVSWYSWSIVSDWLKLESVMIPCSSVFTLRKVEGLRQSYRRFVVESFTISTSASVLGAEMEDDSISPFELTGTRLNTGPSIGYCVLKGITTPLSFS